MNIDRIAVEGLFNRFNHELKFAHDERVAIMIGPNGYGKTTILKILDTLFNKSPLGLSVFPFSSLNVTFDDGTTLRVNARQDPNRNGHNRHRALTFELWEGTTNAQSHTFEPISNPEQYGIDLREIDSILPFLDRIGPEQWVNLQNDEILSIPDVTDRYWQELIQTNPDISNASPIWLNQIREAIPVHFIDTERLFVNTTMHSRRRYGRMRPYVVDETSTARTVTRYSQDLGRKINDTLADYANLSQSLDRTFPVRLVDQSPVLESDETKLNKELIDIELRRKQLTDAGLLDSSADEPQWPGLDDVDKSKLSVLAVYVQDAKKKLAVFNDLYQRVDVLKRIINSRFKHKQLDVDSNGFKISTRDTALDLEVLSSGEQHELVLLYDLLFTVTKGSLILIDEPELSLHVAWQRDILGDLSAVAELSDFQVLLATHSPLIIGKRWDLVVKLNGAHQP